MVFFYFILATDVFCKQQCTHHCNGIHVVETKVFLLGFNKLVFIGVPGNKICEIQAILDSHCARNAKDEQRKETNHDQHLKVRKHRC